ncbi:MAG: ABC transporter ATP-binding protein [bacterium]|nr:ABC transporter ATP-binding protein [bacterium]
MNDVIQVRGLELAYGKEEVLSGLDFDLPAGSVTGLLGPNGAGKSTLLRVLATELRPDAGTVSVLGLDPRRNARAVRRAIGWVPDRVDLPRWMSIDDHMRFLRPFYPTWDKAEVARLLELFELDPRARIADLSKGQRMLEALVAALAHSPRLLLLDEPFSGLDPFARRRVFDGVLDHLRDAGKSVLVVSHSINDLERCCDRVALLSEGRITTCEDIEGLQRRSARVAVSLDPDAVPWSPPGEPIIEETGADTATLFYLDWSDALAAELANDRAVRDLDLLSRDLEDVLVASVARERTA